jgi:hypothetical protein
LPVTMGDWKWSVPLLPIALLVGRVIIYHNRRKDRA